jgi:DNA-directed RNA polymerase II subunit RPB2
MTIAQLIETVTGKATCVSGSRYEATPFEDFNTEDIYKQLHQHGFQHRGNEVLYNGMTGKKMDVMIFIGPAYYQRLKHLVAEKIHSRSTGPLQGLVRQPMEGRSRDGGLRFGEMENNTMVSHGASHFLREKLMTVSDKYEAYVCDKCGLLSTANHQKQQYECRVCEHSSTSKITIPYASKLLVQELMSMQIASRLNVK